MTIYEIENMRVERESETFFVHPIGSDEGAFYDGRVEAIEAAIRAAEGGAAKHVHSFSIWHDRQDRPARGYSRCACGVEPGDDWAEGPGDTHS